MWLPPAGPLRRLAFLVLVDSVGTGLFLTVSALFLTRVAGLSVPAVALGLSVAGFAALVAAIPLGVAGDRFGVRRVWTVLLVVLAVAFAVYAFVRSFPALLAVMVVEAVAQVGVSALRSAYLAHVAAPDLRVRARAFNQAVTNAGFMIGAAGASGVLWLDRPAGYVALLLVNAASFGVGVLVLLTMPAGAPARRGPTIVLTDRRYLVVCVLNGLLMTYLALPIVALPLWIVHRTDAPAWTVGALMVLNTVLVVLLQVRASRGAETVPGAAATIRRSGWWLLAACLVFAVSGHVVALVVGVIVFTVAEVLHSAGAWGVSFGLAPEDKQGQYLGAFTMGTRIYDTIGPGLVTALTLGAGPPGWVVLGLLYLALALLLGTYCQTSVERTGWTL
jgi:MFS family permease